MLQPIFPPSLEGSPETTLSWVFRQPFLKYSEDFFMNIYTTGFDDQTIAPFEKKS